MQCWLPTWLIVSEPCSWGSLLEKAAGNPGFRACALWTVLAPVKCFIVERHNRTVSCVHTGKLLPKLSTVATLGWALTAIAADGMNELTAASQIFQSTHSCDCLNFLLCSCLLSSTSVPFLLSEMAPAVFFPPLVLSLPHALLQVLPVPCLPVMLPVLFYSVLLVLTSTAAGTTWASPAEQAQLDLMPCFQL